MVVGDFRRVEYLLALLKRFASKGFYELCVGGFSRECCLEQSVKGLWTLGVYVVRQICGVDAWICGELLLVQ